MSLQTKALRAADSVAHFLGLLDGPFRAQALMAQAVKQAGSSDFGESDIVEPLERFLASCDADAHLGLIGRLATKWDVGRFLANLLQLRAAERANADILKQPIDRPIFITGLPRSGTTFLHRLMMTDPANRAPLVYETIYPYPDAPGPTDTRPARVARQLRAFERLAPEFRGLHPLDATSPQECSEITAHVFRSLRFDSNYHIPSYRAWLDADMDRQLPAFHFHKRFLQHLRHQDGHPGQWVMKCPEHLFALPAIRAVYPDARLIFVHRDPVKVLLSVAKLTEVLRRPFTRKLDPVQIGRDESARWLDGSARMVEAGDDAGFADPICHVHHMDLVSDPVATVEHVYRHFDLTPPADGFTGIEEYVRDRPNGGYGPRTYRFEDHGLNETAERAKFRPYMVRFGIAAEAPPTSNTRSSRHRMAAEP